MASFFWKGLAAPKNTIRTVVHKVPRFSFPIRFFATENPRAAWKLPTPIFCYISADGTLHLVLEIGKLNNDLTWWFIPLSKWVITLVINGISGVSPLITRVITHLLSGMNHQAEIYQCGQMSWRSTMVNTGNFFRHPALCCAPRVFIFVSKNKDKTEPIWALHVCYALQRICVLKMVSC